MIDDLSDEQLEGMTNSELHRMLTDERWVYVVFNEIADHSRGKIKRLNSVLAKRGYHQNGGTTEPDSNSLKRPITGDGVSEHALLRYVERVKGIDLRAVEAEILAKVKTGESFFKGAVIVDEDGMGYLMRSDGLVKSVMPHAWLDEADRVSLERKFKVNRRKAKDDHFKSLAAQGLDTSVAAAQIAKRTADGEVVGRTSDGEAAKTSSTPT
jgi:hypothetical protein